MAAYTEPSIFVAVALDHNFQLLTSVSLRAEDPAAAEASAIALAIRHCDLADKSAHIITDSKRACQYYITGRVPKMTAALLIPSGLSPTLQRPHNITWTPGHSGLEGNEAANDLARELTNRADPCPYLTPLPSNYGERLEMLRLDRRIYPPPHIKLTTEEATFWRRIQTNTFPNLYLYSFIHPSKYRPFCPWCGDKPTLFHISWNCPQKPPHLKTLQTSYEQWEAALTSNGLEDQCRIIRLVQASAQATGVLN